MNLLILDIVDDCTVVTKLFLNSECLSPSCLQYYLEYANFVFAVRCTFFRCIFIVIPQLQNVGGNVGGSEVISQVPMTLPRLPPVITQPPFAHSSSRGEFCAPSVCSCWGLHAVLLEFSQRRENFMCKLLLKLIYLCIKLCCFAWRQSLGMHVDWGIRKECTEEIMWTYEEGSNVRMGKVI